MLARQAVLRRATLAQPILSPQRILANQIRPLNRTISFLPWRKKKPEPQIIPVYFANPNTPTHGQFGHVSAAEEKKFWRKVKWSLRHYRFRYVT